MKCQTISTLDGIFTLDDSGFYVPIVEPDPEISVWAFRTFWLAAITFCILVLFGAGYCALQAWRAVEALAGISIN
ncbi:hypothetical protein CK227_10365 [Mesorhizobium sp. WSM4308]|uniref:hypothetical protein n=1 Tax=Mesorhizobium sp. WSM4308 TaxID=2029409 RepID=UPI000BAF04E2|nr:hypothetical protein [Mesorhizobium sp. WSM4308]PBB75186.1 hypothetical protein CK227_10365 [Mesorhizobium sp. WSM4308]